MSQAFAIFPTPFAAWSRRVALFSVQIVIVGVLAHRLMSLPTPVALHLFATALVGAAIAIVLGLVAFVLIWRLGRSGAWSATAGVLFGLALFAWPAALVPFFMTLPAINDVTTDPAAPPRFVNLAKQRPKGANDVRYGGSDVARRQAEAYPDIRPLVIPRPVGETYEAVGATLRRLRWKVVSEDPPLGKGRPGYYEATDRTMILGFTDDIVIRLDGDNRETRLDVRSASRFGRHDLGRNANRIRRLFKELETQIEQSLGGGSLARRRRKGPLEAVPKRQKGAPALSAAQAKQQGRAGARPSAAKEKQAPPKQRERPRRRTED
jgi:uncharacterized protein (DUF1499 family)